MKKSVQNKKSKTSKPTETKTVPTVADVLAFVGVNDDRRLSTEEIKRLRRALPGYSSQLDDAATQLEGDASVLAIAGITPELLRALHQQNRELSARETVLEDAYRTVYEQRLAVDDQGIGALQKLARRVNALAEDHPELLDQWKFLLDYLATFYAGTAKQSANETTAPK